MSRSISRILAISIVGLLLSACNTLFPSNGQDNVQVSQASNNQYDDGTGFMSGEPVENSAPVGGYLASNMDSSDRIKLSKALDNAIGRTTKWTNSRTGTRYTVVPVSKSTASGNPFCRNYRMTASQGGQVERQSGTACLGSDGAWHPRS